MENITKCYAILHNMIVGDKTPIQETSHTELATVRAGKRIKLCFHYSALAPESPPPGSIATICAVSQYHLGELEYTKTRR